MCTRRLRWPAAQLRLLRATRTGTRPSTQLDRMVNSARGSGPARSQSPRGRPQSPRGGAKKVTPRGAPGPATNQQQRSNASSSQPLKATAAKLSAAGADKGISKEKNTESAAHLAEAALRKSGINVKLTDEATVMQTDTTMKAIQAAANAGSDMAAKLGLEVSQAALVYAAATAAAAAAPIHRARPLRLCSAAAAAGTAA